MALHDLKTWPEQWQAMVEGRKTFDMRRESQDQRFEVGDILFLSEWDPVTKDYTLPSRNIICRVTYVMRGPIFDLPSDCVIMSVVPFFRSRFQQFVPLHELNLVE